MTEIKIFGNMAKVYLIKEEDSCVLVDTGIKFDRKSIYNYIKNEKVDLIILTHYHIDHIANAHYLSKELEIPIAMSEVDYDIVKNGNEPKLYPYDFVGRILKITSKMINPISNLDMFDIDVFLKNKQSLEKFGINGTVYSLPGHTKGSIGLMVDNDKFFVGDAMMNHFSPSPSKIFENKEEMLQSVDFIKNSSASIIYTGHGKPFKNM
ncbi:MBL fold metallo-hydrolase [Methanobrevibacter sp. TMH8]|uniref:MBL fold metallo-hydrolase n=1 Tax=Methanobrevibacter sp. TMH8 TaxID=2848611 RepID=UPI001CCFB425|nr:MBL fold metallo-hydrolase [Methanobrevibacter sp. TMH8]MBZ9570529.1 MBL fold metallo-hydrolase [Methanobrevibacter sp. TMH8]